MAKKRPKKKATLTDARLAIRGKGWEIWVRKAPMDGLAGGSVPGCIRPRMVRAIEALPPDDPIRILLEDIEGVLDAATPIIGERFEGSAPLSDEERTARMVWEMLQ